MTSFSSKNAAETTGPAL